MFLCKSIWQVHMVLKKLQGNKLFYNASFEGPTEVQLNTW